MPSSSSSSSSAPHARPAPRLGQSSRAASVSSGSRSTRSAAAVAAVGVASMRDVASLHAAAASGAPITAPALPRGSGAEPAYYLAPPGYARAARLPGSAGEAGGVPAHRFSDSKSATPGAVDDDEAPSVPAATLNAGGYWPPQSYGGPGSWRKKGDGNWEWIEAVGEMIEETIVPTLRHNDWSLPQAKQILSSWATLATLLAGTQTSLLNYTSERNASSPTGGLVLGLLYGGIVLEIWGAILAISLIIASITLQAPEAPNRINGAPGTDGGAALGPLGVPRYASVHADGSSVLLAQPSSSSASTGLSSTALAVLDRMTYACGVIVPLGGLLEFVAFTLFAFGQLHVSPTAWHGAVGLAAALAFCVGTTLVAMFGGCVSARRRARKLQRQHMKTPATTMRRHRCEAGTAEDEEKLLEHGAASVVVG